MAPEDTVALGLFLLLSIFSAVAATTIASAAPILCLDTFLTNQYPHDLQATNDSFLSLPSSLRSSLHLSSTPFGQQSSHLPRRLIDSSSLLSSFLSASLPSNHFHVVTPISFGSASPPTASPSATPSTSTSPMPLPPFPPPSLTPSAFALPACSTSPQSQLRSAPPPLHLLFLSFYFFPSSLSLASLPLQPVVGTSRGPARSSLVGH